MNNQFSEFFTIEGAHCLNCESENVRWNNRESDVYCFDCGKWQEEIELEFDYETRLIIDLYDEILHENELGE